MRILAAIATFALVAASCGGAATPVGRSPAQTDAVAAGGVAQATAAATGAGKAAAQPAYLMTRLTDVRTGETFTLGGFDGKVTFFIAMAVW